MWCSLLYTSEAAGSANGLPPESLVLAEGFPVLVAAGMDREGAILPDVGVWVSVLLECGGLDFAPALRSSDRS